MLKNNSFSELKEKEIPFFGGDTSDLRSFQVREENGSQIVTMLGTVTDVVELSGGMSYAIGLEPQDVYGCKYEKLFFIAHKQVRAGLLGELLEPSAWRQLELDEMAPDAEISYEELAKHLLGYTTAMDIIVKNGVASIAELYADTSLLACGYRATEYTPNYMEFVFGAVDQEKPFEII